MKNQFEGVLLIDKPKGMTSHDVVAKVRKSLNERRVGHAGTLDPIATGLMIVLVGRATRLSNYLLNQDKAYEVTVKLGVETDTLDADGVIINKYVGELPTLTKVKEEVEHLKGEFEFAVPEYSAAKVQGKKLYEYARNGEPVPQIIKKMSFEQVTFISYVDDVVKAKIKCSKGSFIRTWASELGKRLMVGGHVLELRRLQSGSLNVADAITLDNLEKSSQNLNIEKAFIPMKNALSHIPQINLSHFEQKLMLDGQIPERINKGLGFKTPLLALIGVEGDLLAIIERSGSEKWQVGCVLGLTNIPKTQ